MKKLFAFAAVVCPALFLGACGGGPANTNTANTAPNSNAAKPMASAPVADQLLAQDKKANEAYFKGDAKFFEAWLSDKFVGYDRGRREDKAAAVKMISGVKCEIKDGWKLEDPQIAKIDADTYVLIYKGTFDGTCTFDGREVKVPSPVRAATVVVRSGSGWMAVYHGENPIIDPKNPPAPEPKTEAKKEEPGKNEPAANSSSPATSKPSASANTDALVKIHSSGWEAFKAKDAKKFEEITGADLSIVDPIGGFVSGKSNVIKHWTETMKCEGISKVSVTDGVATSVTPTLEILTLKGTADGTCDGQKNGDIYQTAFYVKEGDAWKLAFMFEAAGM